MRGGKRLGKLFEKSFPKTFPKLLKNGFLLKGEVFPPFLYVLEVYFFINFLDIRQESCKETYQRSSSGLPPLSRTSEVRLEQFAHIKRDARGSIYATPSGCLHFACWGKV